MTREVTGFQSPQSERRCQDLSAPALPPCGAIAAWLHSFMKKRCRSFQPLNSSLANICFFCYSVCVLFKHFFTVLSIVHNIMTSLAGGVSVTLASSGSQLRGYSDTTPDNDINPPTCSTVGISTQHHVPETPIGSSSAIYNQDLADVMFNLEPLNTDARAALAFNMALAGRIHPLDENELKQLRKGRHAIYGPRQWDTPILSEELPFTFSSLHSPVAIQKALTNETGGENYFRLTSSHGTLENDVTAVVDLLGNITDPNYSSQEAIVQMTSPTINRAKQRITTWEDDFVLSQSNIQVTIAPGGQVFELEYHEHFFSATLFIGSKVLFAFPPHPTNLDLLRRTFQGKLSRIPPLEILPEMQHGIAIIQKRGQELLIPPF